MRGATRSFRPGANNIQFSTLTRVRLGLVIMAMLIFGLGVRNDVSVMRWIAIGVLAITYLLRFWRAQRD